jgi:transposase InsO family protein
VFAWIEAEKAEFPIAKLCRYLQVSASGFYAARDRPESAHAQTDRRLRVLVRVSFDESRQRYGSPRIHEDLLHHSDQGCTYASEDYQAVLEANGITCSMSRRGNCYDNAVMESFFSSVKSEVADRFDSCGEAKMQLFDYIEVFYNQRRRHSTLGYVSPAAYESVDRVDRQSGVESPSVFASWSAPR